MFKKLILLILILSVLLPYCAKADTLDISAKSAILIDAKSGKILYEKEPDIKMPPASITKIMTMLLVMEEIEKGNIKLEDIVTVSKEAAIKAGSHVFLAENEKMSVNDLLKAVAVASANDAAIALGEYISGTKEAFVEKMNKRAKELGMKNTNFINPNGLDAEGHLSTARDISIMTCELLKHPKIFDYTTIWMDTLRDGTFDLANTNKLIRFYEGANGMKTGSTSKAGYCISATALRNGFQLVAVVMNSETTKQRFADASNLLNYGFNTYSSIKLNSKDQILKYVNVDKAIKEIVPVIVKDDIFTTVKNEDKKGIQNKVVCPDKISAPIEKGQKIGEIIYLLNNIELCRSDLIAGENVPKVSFLTATKSIIKNLFNFSLSNPQ